MNEDPREGRPAVGSGLAGQVTACADAPATWWTLPFGCGFDEAAPERIVQVDADLQPLQGAARPNPGVRFHLWIYRKRPDVHRIRSVEFRGLTAARAGGMCCCSRAGVRSRLPLAGRSRWLTSTEGASLRSFGGLRPLRTRCHMLGVGEIRCCDKRLRQWAVCVTFSAAPKTVTHVWRNGVWRSFIY